jgi:aminomethyltransferase
MTEATPRRTPLHDNHVEAGARFVEFSGWEMPVQYSGLIEEHRAVRGAAGMFDVSHMGEILVEGAGAEALLDRLTPNHVTRLTPGQVHYSGLLTEQGTYIDDVLVYRLGPEEFMLVVNASKRTTVADWIASHANGTRVTDASDDWALIALQGPKAVAILAALTPLDLDRLRYYRFAPAEVAQRRVLVSRTGYTGEDGFELYVRPDDAAELWRRLLATGNGGGLLPAGLGARDTLRLEAAMALNGNELDDSTTPWESGLAWTVKMDKGEFIGRSALESQKAEGVSRRLVGFEVTDRGIARKGHEVLAGGRPVGVVTSGTFSPTFEKALGMAYVSPEVATPGQEISIAVRNRMLGARIVELPFYKRSK